jgi:peptidoglycan/xylan/chitin deacetylase (PgdA/CDA1 family)
MTPFWITTSWDDGHRLDLRLADLLDQYGIKGTFYISREGLPPGERLSEPEIAALARRHEVGAHTLSHAVLTDLDQAAARHEVVESRAWLESITGQAVTVFAYPKGRYNTAARQVVAEAGFAAARTVEAYHYDLGHDLLLMPTTIHIYPFPLRTTRSWRAAFGPLRLIRPHLRSLHISWLALRSWPTLALALLNRAAAIGGIWHLWGHSWEIEKYNMWRALEHVLATASQQPYARFVTNTQLVREITAHHERPDEILQPE